MSKASNLSPQQKELQELLKLEDNKTCADCGTKAPRWASWSLGIFVCMECAGLHRNMGTHISRVKSVSLDQWTDEQLENMKRIGNTKSNQMYLAQLPRGFSRGTNMEDYLRRKYIKKEWHGEPGRNNATNNTIRPLNGSASDKYSQQIAQLESMGFKNYDVNLRALDQTNGDVPAAIEKIIAYERSPDIRAQTSSDPISAALTLLEGMGFKDHSANRIALEQSRGDPNEALDLLVKQQQEKEKQQKQQQQQQQLQQQQQQQQNAWGGFQSAQTQSSSNNNKNNIGASLFSIDPPAAMPKQPQSQQQQQQQVKSNNNNIVDLFGSDDPWGSGHNASSGSNPSGPSSNVAAPKPSKEDILSLYNKPIPGAVAPMQQPVNPYAGYNPYGNTGNAPNGYAPNGYAPAFGPPASNPYGGANYGAVAPMAYAPAVAPQQGYGFGVPVQPFGTMAAPTSQPNTFNAASQPAAFGGNPATNPFLSSQAPAPSNPFLTQTNTSNSNNFVWK